MLLSVVSLRVTLQANLYGPHQSNARIAGSYAPHHLDDLFQIYCLDLGHSESFYTNVKGLLGFP